MLVESKPLLEASSQAAQAGESWVSRTCPVPGTPQPGKKRERNRCAEMCRLQIPVCSPHPCPMLLPVWQRGRSAPLWSPGTPMLQQGSAVSLLSLNHAAAVEWELWPMLNEGCAFKREDFQSVNYREHLQLLFKSQRCLSAPSSTCKLGCHPGREQGTHQWISSSARAPGSPTALLGESQGSPGMPSTLRHGLGQLWDSSPRPYPQLCYP